MENPLLPGADSAIGSALNPTFPAGPANIIVPQTDVGHSLSGSAADNTLFAARSLEVGSKGENSVTNLASTNSQTGQSSIDRLTGLPAMPGRSAKVIGAITSLGDGGSGGSGSNSGSSGSSSASSSGSGGSSGSGSGGSSSGSVGGTGGSSGSSGSSGGNSGSSGGSSSGSYSSGGSSSGSSTTSSIGLPASTGVGSTTSFTPLYIPSGSGDKLTGAASGGNLITPIPSPVKPIPSPIIPNGSGDKIIPNGSGDKIIPNGSAGGVGNNSSGGSLYTPIPTANQYTGYSGNPWGGANLTNSNAASQLVVMLPKKPELDVDVSLKPKGLLPPVEKTITIPITGHTPEGKPIYARTTLPDGVTRDEKTGVVNGKLPPEGFYDVINKSLWFTGRVVDGSAGGNSGSNDISASGVSGGVGGSSSGNSSSSGYSAVSAVGGVLPPATNSSSAVVTGATSNNFSDDRGQSIVLDKPITLSGQTLANVFNGGNPVVAQTNTDGAVSVTNGASSGSSILTNGNTKTDLSTREPFANLNPPADKPSGLLKPPNSPIILPAPGTSTSAIGKSFINADGQSITFDKPTALTNKALADLFNNGKPVVTQALANGTVKVLGDQSASTSNLVTTNGNLTSAQGTAPTSGNNQATQPGANPKLVPISKELLNPPSEAQSSLIPLAPFITPSTQTGKDATGITFTDDRGQIITLGSATTLSGQTLANLFNNGNSVVAQTKPNGDVSLVDSAKQATQNSYDALGTLVFKDPAPQPPVQTAKPKPTNSPFEGATANGAPLDNSQAISDSNPPSLESRIKDWQQSLGVTPDGIIGPETIAAAGKNWVGKGVDFVKNNSTLATKVVLSALGLGGTPDPNAPNQKQIDQNIRDILRSSPRNNQIDVLGITDTIELVTNTYKGFTNVTNEARDFWANEFAKGNGLAIVPGLVATSLDSDHLPGTALTIATVGGGAALGATKAGQAVLSSPIVLSALALNTGLNGGQAITGKDLQGNELSGTDRFVKGASTVLDLIGLGGVRNITLGKNSGIADDAANLGVKTGNGSPTNAEPTGNPAGAIDDGTGVSKPTQNLEPDGNPLQPSIQTGNPQPLISSSTNQTGASLQPSTLNHILQGDITPAGNLSGGLHTQQGLDDFLTLRSDIQPSINSLPNGVKQVTLPKDAFNSKGYSQTVAASNNGLGVPGGKTLFPDTWNGTKINSAVNEVIGQNQIISNKSWAKVYEGTVDGVKMRVSTDASGNPTSAYPTWNQ